MCSDLIEVMFLCQVAAVASQDVPQCSSSAGGRRRGVNVSSTLSNDVILLRFTAVDMFLCVGDTDDRVRLKQLVSIEFVLSMPNS